ncbi:MAG: diguanylate cyclase [Planctomycetota bacterium]|nr:diguanylate cyclase [Planctomycetota bacterium]
MSQSILVIDASPQIHEFVRIILAGEAVVLHHLRDGSDAVTMATALVPDLILLDSKFAHRSGFEICNELKLNPSTAKIPVLLMIDSGSLEQRASARDYGALDYLNKPLDPSEARSRVGLALRIRFLTELLNQRAMTDGLTGLWNAAFFEQRLESELALSRRAVRPVACLFLDIDHFKLINSQHGRATGDMALRAIAGTLVAGCRLEDLVCRRDGGEFAILCPNTDASRATILAERLRERVAGLRLTYNDELVEITCSVGIADGSCGDGPSILSAAGAARDRAKAGGHNRVYSAAVDGNSLGAFLQSPLRFPTAGAV